MKYDPWLLKHMAPVCTRCGEDTSNKSLICSKCRYVCPLCGLAKSYHAKICLDCRQERRRKGKKGKRREKSNRRSVPTTITLDDGTVIETRSKLEAAWILRLQHCPFICYECRPVPCMQLGKAGPFIGGYLPDLLLQDVQGNEILCELKPTAAIAKKDSRAQRSLVLDPSLRFLVIGGQPEDTFYVKLLSSEGIMEYESIKVDQLLSFFGCKEE